MTTNESIALDLEELNQLRSIAKRPRVLAFISTEISNLEKMAMENVGTPVHVPSTKARSPAVSDPSVKYITVSSFSWDQDNDQLKIYVSLEGVNEEKIAAEFKPTSFDIKFHDVEGRNYRCAIVKLNKEIVPEKCKLVVKPKRVVISLAKASKGNWLDLHFKEDKLKPNMDKEKDPMAGIMDLMKNMYEEGDDEMKKTIAKAWTDARSGKTADPLKTFQ